jgi:hypothetical protein
MSGPQMKIPELYKAVMDWVIATGAQNLNATPGLWKRRTERCNGIGPFDVKLNPHHAEIDGVPPYSVAVGMDDYFPGIIALVGPTGGVVIPSPRENENEAGLIKHFAEQP